MGGGLDFDAAADGGGGHGASPKRERAPLQTTTNKRNKTHKTKTKKRNKTHHRVRRQDRPTAERNREKMKPAWTEYSHRQQQQLQQQQQSKLILIQNLCPSSLSFPFYSPLANRPAFKCLVSFYRFSPFSLSFSLFHWSETQRPETLVQTRAK